MKKTLLTMKEVDTPATPETNAWQMTDVTMTTVPPFKATV